MKRLTQHARLALLGLLVFLAQCTGGCVTNDAPLTDCHAPDLDALLEETIEQWEAVDGEPVAGDFRDAVLFEFVEGGEGAWHPACGHQDTLKGCTVWDRDAWVFHVQVQWCMTPSETQWVVYHELGHALARHHFGDMDMDHLRPEVWVDVVGELQDGIE